MASKKLSEIGREEMNFEVKSKSWSSILEITYPNASSEVKVSDIDHSGNLPSLKTAKDKTLKYMEGYTELKI